MVVTLTLGLLLHADVVEVGSLRWRPPALATHRDLRVIDDGPWGAATEDAWDVTRDDGTTLRVVRVVPRRAPRWPATDGELVAAWRRFHGCTATPLPSKPRAPKQLAFSGSCEGGDTYALRTQLVEEPDGTVSVYELHADRPVMKRGPPLDAALSELVASVEPGPCIASLTFEPARSDAGVRFDLDGDGKADQLRVASESSGSGSGSLDLALTFSRGARVQVQLEQSFASFTAAAAVPAELAGLRAQGAVTGALARLVCREPDASLEWLLDPALRWKPGRPQPPKTYALVSTTEAARALARDTAPTPGSRPPLPGAAFLVYLGANHARSEQPFDTLDTRGTLSLLGTAHGVVLYDSKADRHAWLFVYRGGEKLRWPSIVGASFGKDDVVVRTRAIDGKANETHVDPTTGRVKAP